MFQEIFAEFPWSGEELCRLCQQRLAKTARSYRKCQKLKTSYFSQNSPIDLKLGEKLDINKRNDSRQKNPTPDVMTSRDVIMTSSKIWKEKTADVSTFWATLVVEMYFIQKRNSKHKKWGVNHYQGMIGSKVMTTSDFDGFWWRHHHCDVTVTSLWPRMG